MPCYLVTYHAYGSWLPDRRRGYVRRDRGIIPADTHVAKLYRRDMAESPVVLNGALQRAAIAALLDSQQPQRFNMHAMATDRTHVHALLSWRDSRDAVKMRALLKGSVTRALNAEFGRRNWLAEGGSRKQVRDRRHFDHLRTEYLPKHTGWKWLPERGYFL